MIYGYTRVSPTDQDFSVQLDALKKYGRENIRREKVSGKTIIDLGSDNDVETSAEYEAVLNTYQVDVSKKIDSLFSFDVKSMFEQLYI